MGRAAGSSGSSIGTSPTGVGVAPEGEPYAAVKETHTSVVLLMGGRAYKVKKPVALPFLDFSTRAARMTDCLREVELNARIAPDVYLGVDELMPVTGRTGDAGEPVVVMRRMPEARRLSGLLADPAHREEARRCVVDTARQIAAFHAGLPPVEGHDLVGTMAALWWEGRDQTRVFEDGPLDREGLDETYGLAAEYLAGRSDLLRSRERAGLVRDGHGDLLTEDIFWLDDGARILDCLEFDRRLRVGDVLLDIAFLAMDLTLRGAGDLARLAIDHYRELDAESHPRSLEHHYVAYRAWVRAKVECLRGLSGDLAAPDRAVAALALARRELRAGRVHLVAVGGLPATGKSTLAGRLVDTDDRDWVLLSSDEIRKGQAGMPATSSARSPFGTGIYDERHTEAAYAELLRRAATALDRGLCVVLDASWTSSMHRAGAAVLAQAHDATYTPVHCVAPEQVCRARLGIRQVDLGTSDATVEVYQRMAAQADPWPEALEVDTTQPAQACAARILDALEGQPVPPRHGPIAPG